MNLEKSKEMVVLCSSVVRFVVLLVQYSSVRSDTCSITTTNSRYLRCFLQALG